MLGFLLSSLETDKQTYKDAKNLLVLAFASEESRKVSTIKQLIGLKLNQGDDPFGFISKLRTINESVKTLNITSQDFLQYFTWLGLGEDFQKELEIRLQNTSATEPADQWKELKQSYRKQQKRLILAYT